MKKIKIREIKEKKRKILMMLFNRNSVGACLNCWAGLLILYVGLLCKNKKQKGSAGACPLPLRCLIQLFPRENKMNYLENEFSLHKSAYLSFMGWPGI